MRFKKTKKELPIKVCAMCGTSHKMRYYFGAHGEDGLAFCSKDCAHRWVAANNGEKPVPPVDPTETKEVKHKFFSMSVVSTHSLMAEVYERTKELYDDLDYVYGNSETQKALVIITEDGHLRVLRCDPTENVEILSRFIKNDLEREYLAEDFCEVLYMLDVPHKFIDEGVCVEKVNENIKKREEVPTETIYKIVKGYDYNKVVGYCRTKEKACELVKADMAKYVKDASRVTAEFNDSGNYYKVTYKNSENAEVTSWYYLKEVTLHN